MQDGGLEPCDSDNFTIDQVEDWDEWWYWI
jgi:hypothetical protein